MATQLYHPKTLRAIVAIARYYAREETKCAIRARGEKISDYDPKDITRMAHALLEQRWEEFSAKAKASGVIRELQEACERKEQRRLERKSKHLSNSRSAANGGLLLNETQAQNGAPR